MSDRLLTTGQAARACSVTADTVLKWIRSGVLPSRRTPGGHHRIDERDLHKVAGPLAARGNRPEPAQPPSFQFCWEYKGKKGTPNGCRKCVAYLARAQRCYELAGLVHSAVLCKSTCRDCDYFRWIREQTTNLILVTGDPMLTRRLQAGCAEPCFNLEVAEDEYACSALIDRFRPDFVIVDSHLGRTNAAVLIRHLLKDPRIPAVQVMLAAEEKSSHGMVDRKTVATIRRPSGAEDIHRLVQSVRR